MKKGYIKLYRKLLESGMLKNPHLTTFWIWCLLKASHKKTKALVGYQEIALNPGQFIFGRKKASEEIGVTPQRIRTCLNFLKKTQRLTIKTTNKFSIITIIKWGDYQSDIQQDNQQTNQQLTNNQPTTNQQLTTNKNVKECIKNVKNESSCPELSDDISEPILKITTVSKNSDGTSILFSIYQDDIDQWQEAFPAVNVPLALRQIKSWNNANPTKRKTPNGMKRHINIWLTREQNKGGNNQNYGHGAAAEKQARNLEELRQAGEELKEEGYI